MNYEAKFPLEFQKENLQQLHVSEDWDIKISIMSNPNWSRHSSGSLTRIIGPRSTCLYIFLFFLLVLDIVLKAYPVIHTPKF